LLLVFNKPYGVLSQFTPDGSPNRTLAEFGFPKSVYPIGRLDADTEGLLLLSDEAELNERLLHPRHAHEREYWAQVERIPAPEALARLTKGVEIRVPNGPNVKVAQFAKVLPRILPLRGLSRRSVAKAEGDRRGEGERFSNFTSLPCRAWILDPQPEIPPRVPPIRFRKTVPTCWVGLELVEGKNRQVRRMTAVIGHPTLRLIRVRIGALLLGDLRPGKWRELDAQERKLALS
jgi:23S rRNA pseudouridine2457 synthase